MQKREIRQESCGGIQDIQVGCISRKGHTHTTSIFNLGPILTQIVFEALRTDNVDKHGYREVNEESEHLTKETEKNFNVCDHSKISFLFTLFLEKPREDL